MPVRPTIFGLRATPAPGFTSVANVRPLAAPCAATSMIRWLFGDSPDVSRSKNTTPRAFLPRGSSGAWGGGSSGARGPGAGTRPAGAGAAASRASSARTPRTTPARWAASRSA